MKICVSGLQSKDHKLLKVLNEKAYGGDSMQDAVLWRTIVQELE